MNGNPWRACALGAVGLLAGGVLGACGGDDEADPKPTFSSSTASPTAASTSPTAASSSAAPEESPEAFVRRWNQLSTKMQNTGDAADYLAASQSCSSCATVAQTVQSYFQSGGSVSTSGWKLSTIRCKPSVEFDIRCRANVASAPTKVSRSTGAPVETLPGGSFVALFYLTKLQPGNWNMANLEKVAS